MTTNTGGPTFPCDPFIASNPRNETVAKRLAEGMTLRDYFAAKAMQGLIASNDSEAGDRIDDIPVYAYQIADAMLKARSEGEPHD